MSTAILATAVPGANVIAPSESMETDEALYELIHGQRVELWPMSVRAGTIATRLTGLLNAFAKPTHLGEAFTEMLIVVPVPDDEERNRRPTSFLCRRQGLRRPARKIPTPPPGTLCPTWWSR